MTIFFGEVLVAFFIEILVTCNQRSPNCILNPGSNYPLTVTLTFVGVLSVNLFYDYLKLKQVFGRMRLFFFYNIFTGLIVPLVSALANSPMHHFKRLENRILVAIYPQGPIEPWRMIRESFHAENVESLWLGALAQAESNQEVGTNRRGFLEKVRQILDFVKASLVKKPVFVRLPDLEVSKFWRRMAFKEAMLFNAVKLSKVQGATPARILLSVDPTNANYGIYNSPGKRFVNRALPSDHRNLGFLSSAIQAYLEGEQVTLDSDSTPMWPMPGPPRVPFRWASGGVLPIINWKSRRWFVLVSRIFDPVGLNLPVGGSESSKERFQIEKLLQREFHEEIVLVNGDPADSGLVTRKTIGLSPGELLVRGDPLLVDEILARKFHEEHDRLRDTQDGVKIQSDMAAGIPLTRLKTPFEVNVNTQQDGKGILPKYSDVLPVLNLFEHGIEIVAPIYFEVDSTDTILFGERWERAMTLLRNPIVLLSYDFLKKAFASGEEYLSPPDYAGASSEDVINFRDGRRIKKLSSKDYHVFPSDIELRERRIGLLRGRRELTTEEEKELGLHERWIRKYGVVVKNLIERESSGDANEVDLNADASRFLTLCPAAWKTIELMFKYNILQESLRFGASKNQ